MQGVEKPTYLVQWEVLYIPLSEDISPRATTVALAESLGTDSESIPETGLWKLKYVTKHQGVYLLIGAITQGGSFQNFASVSASSISSSLCSSGRMQGRRLCRIRAFPGRRG